MIRNYGHLRCYQSSTGPISTTRRQNDLELKKIGNGRILLMTELANSFENIATLSSKQLMSGWTEWQRPIPNPSTAVMKMQLIRTRLAASAQKPWLTCGECFHNNWM